MAEYIEKEALKNKLRAYNCTSTSDNLDYNRGLNDALRYVVPMIIAGQPTEDVVPVVHGRLVLRAVSDVTSTFMCSECGREFEVANAYFGTPTNHPDKNYPYCNCGARMDGE
jgi:hypothetical protein